MNFLDHGDEDVDEFFARALNLGPPPADDSLAICNAILPHRFQNAIQNAALHMNVNHEGDAETARLYAGYDLLSIERSDRLRDAGRR